MAFGMSPFPLQFGSRGGGGIPTLSPSTWAAIVASLGLTQAGASSGYGEEKFVQPAAPDLTPDTWAAIATTLGLTQAGASSGYGEVQW